MQKKDIYKIDNLLINIGRFVLVISLLNVGCSMSANTLGNDWEGLAIGISAAISLLVTGSFIRHRENQIIAIWNILEHSTEVPVQELMHNTGFERAFIQDALLLINRRGKAYYVWDKKSDIIVDGRLRTTLLVMPKCDNCGATVNQTMTLDFSQRPTCFYCGKSVTTEQINQLKSEAIDKIRMATPIETTKEFSLWVFILLFMVFWPAAVGYALWKADVVKRLRGKK
jgi:hypothetical protein